MTAQNSYGVCLMAYSHEIPANQPGKSENVWVFRKYGLYLVWVIWESTVWVMGYGVWRQNPCKPTRETQKCMGLWRVWVMTGIGYGRVDCTSILDVCYHRAAPLTRGVSTIHFMLRAKIRPSQGRWPMRQCSDLCDTSSGYIASKL